MMRVYSSPHKYSELELAAAEGLMMLRRSCQVHAQTQPQAQALSQASSQAPWSATKTGPNTPKAGQKRGAPVSVWETAHKKQRQFQS